MAEIIGIDHGNGNMKTTHVVFPCGFTKQSQKPKGTYSNDYIMYNGSYYILSQSRFNYEVDKTKNENCLVLTLFAIAKEISERYKEEGRLLKGYVGKDIVLSVGLPPAHYEKQMDSFTKYFEGAFMNGVHYEYNDIIFDFHVKKVLVFPQNFSALFTCNYELIKDYSTVFGIDIGDGTVDLLGVVDGLPEKKYTLSRELGVSKLREQIIDSVINDFSFTLDERSITDVFMNKKTVLDLDIEDRIKELTEEWASRIIDQLHTKVPDFRIAPTVFCGGGSVVLKPYLEKSDMFKLTIFNDDIHCNASGYEILAECELNG